MLIIGHRGARALAPENTLPALRLGMGCADYVEVDVRLSLDGVPVVIHDATLDRTTDGTGPVGDFTLEELRTLDAGMGTKIPTLQGVLELLGGGCGLVVEIKESGSEGAICAILRNYRPDNLFIVSSSQESVSLAKLFLLGIRTGLIYSKEPASLINLALSIHADALLPKKNLLNRELVAEAHLNGILVIPWTVNKPEEIRDAVSSGADGFVTDDPCSAMRLLSLGDNIYIVIK